MNFKSNIPLIKEFLKLNREICGHVYIVNGELVLYCDSVGTSVGGDIKTRGSCQHSIYSSIIWHTHPNISLPYPSVEDILKVIKPRTKPELITTSFIFTSIGIWSIQGKKREITPEIESQVKKIVYDLHFIYKDKDKLENYLKNISSIDICLINV